MRWSLHLCYLLLLLFWVRVAVPAHVIVVVVAVVMFIRVVAAEVAVWVAFAAVATWRQRSCCFCHWPSVILYGCAVWSCRSLVAVVRAVPKTASVSVSVCVCVCVCVVCARACVRVCVHAVDIEVGEEVAFVHVPMDQFARVNYRLIFGSADLFA